MAVGNRSSLYERLSTANHCGKLCNKPLLKLLFPAWQNILKRNWIQDLLSNVFIPFRFDHFGGGAGGGRPIITYRDLDAPRDADEF